MWRNVSSRSNTRLSTSPIVSSLVGSVSLLACSARYRQSLACGVMGNRPSVFGISQTYTRFQNGSEQYRTQGLPSGNQPGHYLGGATLNLGTLQDNLSFRSTSQSWITLLTPPSAQSARAFSSSAISVLSFSISTGESTVTCPAKDYACTRLFTSPRIGAGYRQLICSAEAWPRGFSPTLRVDSLRWSLLLNIFARRSLV